MAILFQLARFGLVGVMNTAITAVVIIGLTLIGVPLFLANAIGFGCGLVNSFYMNKRFTFQSSGSGRTFSFIIAFLVSYCINLGVVYFMASILEAAPLVAQISGMLVYNIVFFIFMKVWVFERRVEKNHI